MVNSRSIKFALLLALTASQTSILARTVKNVTIDEKGLNLDTADSNLDQGCKSFKPTTKQVRRYFTKAYPVDSYTITTARYSPCYATGTVIFSDNSSGRFQLSSGGSARLFWSRGGTVYLLYKHNQWHDPFSCTYGLGDEPEC